LPRFCLYRELSSRQSWFCREPIFAERWLSANDSLPSARYLTLGKEVEPR
jgi:hypothetical protein